MRTALLFLSWLAALACPAASAADPLAAETLEQKVRACAAMTAETARLACYDRLGAALAAERATPSPVASPPKPPPAAPVAASPKPAPATPNAAAASHTTPATAEPATRSAASARAERAARAAPIAARVTALSETAVDGLVITLDNGETWRTIPEDTRLLLKVGDPVMIERGAFGSFRLSAANGRVARVNRLR